MESYWFFFDEGKYFGLIVSLGDCIRLTFLLIFIFQKHQGTANYEMEPVFFSYLFTKLYYAYIIVCTLDTGEFINIFL